MRIRGAGTEKRGLFLSCLQEIEKKDYPKLENGVIWL